MSSEYLQGRGQTPAVPDAYALVDRGSDEPVVVLIPVATQHLSGMGHGGRHTSAGAKVPDPRGFIATGREELLRTAYALLFRVPNPCVHDAGVLSEVLQTGLLGEVPHLEAAVVTGREHQVGRVVVGVHSEDLRTVASEAQQRLLQLAVEELDRAVTTRHYHLVLVALVPAHVEDVVLS